MRISEGVEWALHTCLLLEWVEQEAVPAAKLAEYHALPPAYLNKQLQALAAEGILASLPGPKGGFRLVRPLERITLLDVVAAIEGREYAFRCSEIRQQGPGATTSSVKGPCSIAAAMWRAELAWRRELMGQTLADVRAETDRKAPHARRQAVRWFG